MDPIIIEYRFQLEDDREDSFQMEIDMQTLRLLNKTSGKLSAWTQLTNHQCPNCPLDTAVESICPAAENMSGLVERFDHLLSFDQTMVSVITPERLVYSHTTVQHGVCSLMGLLMATSNCPLTAFFKPMARFHLPFASTQETIWRATSTYLLAQYFLNQEGMTPDLNFEGLSQLYSEIQIVNSAFAKRLRTACQYDSMVNAIILLDMFAKSMPSAIDESLEEIQHFFVPYLSHVDPPQESTSESTQKR